MAPRIERFSRDQSFQRGVVFVRAFLTGSVTIKPGESSRKMQIAFGNERWDAATYVPESEIVAMVVDDARYAFADVETYDHARGQGLKFATPQDAARHLAALGWTVTEPDVSFRSHLEVTVGGKTASITTVSDTRTTDAHVEPIGEPRFYVRRTPRYAGADEYEVLDRGLGPDDGPTRWRAAGPFPTRHLAQAEADDLNNGDAQ